jgi:hypothetical protein
MRLEDNVEMHHSEISCADGNLIVWMVLVLHPVW